MKKTAILLLATILLGSFASCNSDSDSTSYTYTSPSSTAVTAFSLLKNDDILNNLDSVFFSIDLVSANIFNADSLPYGTKINRLQLSISTNSCSVVKLTVPNGDGTFDEIDYLTNSTDSIDFSHGPVMLQLVSSDGVNARDYTVRVNVHQVQPDLLYWNRTASAGLPTSLSAPSVQKSVCFADRALCLTADAAGSYCLASTSRPEANDWQMASPVFPSPVRVESLTATPDALFILATDGSLLTSADGLSWSATGQSWSVIIGSCQSTLLGLRSDGSSVLHCTYPASAETPIADDFPVSGFSQLAHVGNRWTSGDQCIAVGGRLADGSLSGATWSFDGSSWAKFNDDALPAADGRTLLSYNIIETDTISWRHIDRQVLLTFGGRWSDGSIDKTVYISYDLGLNWKKADELLQLPASIPALAFAQALVFDSTLTARSDFGWTAIPGLPIPAYFSLETPLSARSDSWECPYIYLFGGVGQDGNLSPTLFRGVLTRLTFQPLH